MLKFKIFILFLLPLSMLSQQITGKIYDQETTVKGATIFNTSKSIITHTDEKGDFEIKASVNDTIIFYSLFHKQQTLKLVESHFNNTIVIELKKTINALEEVMVTNNPKEKEFIAKLHNENFNEQIKNDLKENTHLYRPAPSGGGFDFIKIASLIGKLFKSKKSKTSSCYYYKL